MKPARAHWDAVYRGNPADSLSWYESRPATSLRLIGAASPDGSVIDVGAGESFLAEALLAEGRTDVTLLDLSADALAAIKERLGERPALTYVVTDLLEWAPERRYDVWHDRAVFHFLTAPEDIRRYVAVAARTVVEGGAVVLGTFAEDGPRRCSGLPTARYRAEELASLFARDFDLEHSEREDHRTPSGAVQPLTWVVLRRVSR